MDKRLDEREEEIHKKEAMYDSLAVDYRLAQEEIEKLNKEIESWIKLIDYKGIEDIPQYVSDLEVDNKQLKEENQLLNKNYNIINELEHYLKLEKWKSVGGIHLGVINEVLNKLQELKGSDKVE